MNARDAGSDRQLTVYVVDDDEDVRDALRLLLKLQGYEAALFGSAEDFLRTVHPGIAGCLITDIRMPGMSGLELQQELASRCVPLPVIVLTAHGDVASARTALRARAVDFLMKPFKAADLSAAIEVAFERERGRIANSAAESADQALVGSLTPREREVAVLLATGAQNLEIAHKLGISPRTVEIHKARCMAKLRTRSLADLVRLCDRTGLRA